MGQAKVPPTQPMFAGQAHQRGKFRKEHNWSLAGNRSPPRLALSRRLDPRYMTQKNMSGEMSMEPVGRGGGRPRVKQSISTPMLLESARERLDDLPNVYL